MAKKVSRRFGKFVFLLKQSDQTELALIYEICGKKSFTQIRQILADKNFLSLIICSKKISAIRELLRLFAIARVVAEKPETKKTLNLKQKIYVT
ncbi:hypothetical protein HYN56_04300 [Flavobacterium crocinum]|uniref:Uncharacterized protein n=1 Tax=Flavobacterium crocinum TaxID=2183896 RepID=A0A2S1YHD5_9FLAO|nr:hypothetical protein [Flavobacterium crocinum]AWK03483.1 hypothetical protein HYN56_04300 [Flavobacterium crocinum]